MEEEDEILELTKSETKKLWDKLFGVEYTVQSFDPLRQREGVTYSVWHKGDDTYTCSCKSFIYKTGLENVWDILGMKRHKGTCKHIRYIMKNIEGMRIRVGRI